MVIANGRIIARFRIALKADVMHPALVGGIGVAGVDRDADRGQTPPAFRSPSAAGPMGETGSR
jgi:hypothetical protein